jgi:hypothetical protein
MQIGGSMDAERWQFVSKFGYGLGEGAYSLKVKTSDKRVLQSGQHRRKPPSLQMELYLDEDWANVESLPACDRSSQGPARNMFPLLLNRETGEWGPAGDGFLLHVIRSHIWYFAVSDCDNVLGNKTIDLEYEFHSVQADGSELGIEARHMPVAESLAFFCFFFLLFRVAIRCRSIRESSGALHPAIWALAGAAAMQSASQLLHLLHLLRYTANGEGFWMLDVVSELLFMGSQVVHATLLIAIARGFTLLPMKTSEQDGPRLGFIATLAAHAALVGFGKLQEGSSSHRHHSNDGLSGWVIMIVRLLLLACFVSAARSTRARSGYRLEGFMRKFELAGSLYFLAYPLVFLLAQAFAPYLRQPIMQVGLLGMQAAGDLWLTDMFLSRGAYFKASQLSATLLPGGADGFCFAGLNKDD